MQKRCNHNSRGSECTEGVEQRDGAGEAADDEVKARFSDYALVHMQITPNQLKSTALSRIRDLYELLHTLEDKDAVVMCSEVSRGGCERDDSIFGFSRLLVHDINEFNEGVKGMVARDSHRCWKVNGRQSLQQPTGPVYEIFRQLGIHPVKGTGGTGEFSKRQEHGGGGRGGGGCRDFLTYTQYVFSFDRMLKNCGRLRIGAIANRLSSKPCPLP